MAQIVAIEHITLDGVMQAPARPDEDRRDGFEHGGWAAAAGSDSRMQQLIGARMGRAWSLLAGRRTYEDFAKVWPNRPKPNPMGEALTGSQKFVVSNTLTEPLPWENSTLPKGDAVEAVARLKREHDKTLVVFGSGALLQSLMPHALVDEFVLQIHPLVLGVGRRLFSETGTFAKLTLLESVTTSAGVIVAVYRA